MEIRIDDLEMDIVAALEAQQMQRIGIDANNEPTLITSETNANTNEANCSPKEMRKFDSKKRWKNWGWKYSPGGKTSSIEEEPTEQTASAKTSRHSSPTSSPKHKKSGETTAAMVVVSNLLNQSPLRRRPQSSRSNGRTTNNNATSTTTTTTTPNQTNRNEIRSSAGARLCQTLDNLQDDANEEFQALIINGRPASVHIIPMSSNQNF